MSATLTYEHKRSLWREGHFGVDDTLTYYHFDIWNTLAWSTLASCLLWHETLWRMRHFGVAHFGMRQFDVKTFWYNTA